MIFLRFDSCFFGRLQPEMEAQLPEGWWQDWGGRAEGDKVSSIRCCGEGGSFPFP